MSDAFDLQRFVDAQRDIYQRALAELEDARKRSHWMWFVFPQLAGLGSSSMARRYAISSAAEARAYLDHDVLGMRLTACTEAVNRHPGRSAREIFGEPDDVKFRSSMTLFAEIGREVPCFAEALRTFFHDERDPLTMKVLRSAER